MLNTRKLLRELKARGYQGGPTQLILYVQPYRTSREERAVRRFETLPGQQAQVDWGSFGYISQGCAAPARLSASCRGASAQSLCLTPGGRA